jgi:hypothetical protein
MKPWKILILFLFAVLLGLYLVLGPKAFEQKRNHVISDLDSAIAQAKESGDYNCCIEPPCRMCYLGEWIFEDGKCDCDKYVSSGELDKVCPECKNATSCESEDGDTCSVGL